MMRLLFTRLFTQSKSPQKPANACELFDAEFVLMADELLRYTMTRQGTTLNRQRLFGLAPCLSCPSGL